MRAYEFEGKIRINKTKAKNLFNKGCQVWVMGNKSNPYSAWIDFCTLDLNDRFEEQINTFEYYLCRELGLYTSYFVKKEVLIQ